MNESLWVAKESAGRAEFRDYKLAVGHAMGSLLTGVLWEIWRQHPQLIPPELDGAPLRRVIGSGPRGGSRAARKRQGGGAKRRADRKSAPS